MRIIGWLTSLLIIAGCSSPPSSYPGPYYERLNRAWAKVLQTYPHAREIPIQLEFAIPPWWRTNKWVGQTPWTGDRILIEPSYANSISDLKLEALLVHELTHVLDIRAGKTVSDLDEMEKKAYLEADNYMSREIANGREQ